MRILLVEDNDSLREEIADFLQEESGYTVHQCGNGRQALEVLENHDISLIVSDIRMPGMDGIQMLEKLNERSFNNRPPVILITGFADIQSAISALRAGASDYLTKPLKPQELAEAIRKIDRRKANLPDQTQPSGQSSASGSRLATRSPGDSVLLEERGPLLVCSDAMRRILLLVERFHQDPSVPVLIEGETGTGKELIARMIHNPAGDDNSICGPFVSLNCAAISMNLFESELFGYEPGAFTGASPKGAPGKLELAAEGSLMLDEIGDLPLEQQPKLLRVLQEKEYYRVGGQKKKEMKARLICATNQNLKENVENGSFRRDLYFRLNIGRIYLPPLRERKEAILPLARKFLNQFATVKGSRFAGITDEAADMLLKYEWPGNIRELHNAMEWVVLLFDDFQLRPEHLAMLDGQQKEIPDIGGNLLKPGSIVLPRDKVDLKKLEAELVRKALEKFRGNKTRTANYLCISRRALDSRIKNAF